MSDPLSIRELYLLILDKMEVDDILPLSLTNQLAAQISAEQTFWEEKFIKSGFSFWRRRDTVAEWIAEYNIMKRYTLYLQSIIQGTIVMAEIGPGVVNAYLGAYGPLYQSLDHTLFHHIQTNEKQNNVYIIKYSSIYNIYLMEFYSYTEGKRSSGYINSASIFHIRVVLLGLLIIKANIREMSPTSGFSPDILWKQYNYFIE